MVDALRAGRNGEVEIQTTRRAERWSETVVWPADVVQGVPRQGGEAASLAAAREITSAAV